MTDPHEIIITTRENPNQPRVVQFSDLFSLRDNIKTMTYLWNTNCYHVDVVNRVFIINGGRKIKFDTAYGECRILYRRRNQVSYNLHGRKTEPERRVSWLIGIEEKKTEKVIFLIVSGDGRSWEWRDQL